MKTINCENCSHFVNNIFHEYTFDVTEKAYCKLGKRIMFRVLTGPPFTDGYRRRCKLFKSILIT